ncbi:ABC transporter substrate-binding protein [Xylanivirga thermophila]|uniref:ABC transporter substrate-binding protein n=1 Tax=Xylanivirga thermophila TaxID=2496273 RepID=UPI00101B5B61|nr:sugar ABC transporter substrate-binding protein [Xylanivirga thermophila]
MKNFKKAIVLVLCMVLIFTTACGKSEEPKDQQGADKTDKEQVSDKEGKMEGEITFWTLSLSPTFDDYLNGVIDSFEKENTGVKVVWQDIPFDQAEQQTLAAASAGNLADVVNLNTDFLKKLGALGALVNMDEAASDVKDDYFEGAWNAGKVNGTAYAIPWYLSNSVMLYNKELLKEAGFDNPPATDEEAWEMSKTIHEKTGAYGNTVGDIHLYFPMNGIPLVSEDGTKAAFNTPEALEKIKFFKEKYDEGLIPDEMLLSQANVPEWYAQEKLAWWQTGPQLFRQVKDLSPEVYDKSDAAPAILGSLGKSSMAVMNVAVSAKSKNQDAAVAFAKYITNGKNQLEFCKIVSILPSVIEAAEDEFFTKGADSDDPAEKGKYYSAQQLENAEDFFVPVENISQINKVINEEFHKVMLDNKDPQKALDDAEKQVNDLLK